jgi:hypothetical protein
MKHHGERRKSDGKTVPSSRKLYLEPARCDVMLDSSAQGSLASIKIDPMLSGRNCRRKLLGSIPISARLA